MGRKTTWIRQRSLESLTDIPLTKPSGAGDHWKGIELGKFANLLTELVTSELPIGYTEYHTDATEQDLVCVFAGEEISSWQGRPFRTCLTVLTSNRRVFATRAYAGVYTVCPIQLFECITSYKHVSNYDLDSAFSNFVGFFSDEEKELESLLNRLWETKIDANETLLAFSRADVMRHQWPKMRLIDTAFQEKDNKTAWGLLECCAEILESCSPPLHIAQTLTISRMIRDRVDQA